MSRRLSTQLKNPKKAKGRVKFSDELVFLESIKDNDVDNIRYMLRRASLKVDLNKINDSGLTPLHQAALDNSAEVVALLIESKADVNVIDEDTWTPLHAACSMGHYDVAKFLLENGANPHIISREGERPLDLIDQSDFPLISLLLNHMKDYPSDEDLSDNEVQIKFRRDRKGVSKSSLPTDPVLLAEFCERNLSKILKQAKINVDDMVLEIKKAFQNDRFLKSKDFILYLTISIVDSCMSHMYHNDSKLNTEMLSKKLPIIGKFIGNTTDLELECLYAVQKLDVKYNHPPETYLIHFLLQFNKKETFKQWRKNENPYLEEMKHKESLNLLKDFFDF